MKLRIFFILFLLCVLSSNVWPRLASAKLEEKPWLQTGKYVLKATFKLSDSEQPMVNLGGEVSVNVTGTEMKIKVPVIAEPINVKINGKSLKGKLEREGARVEFEGDIIEKDHVEGIFRGEMGPKRVYGIWSMRLSPTGAQKSVT